MVLLCLLPMSMLLLAYNYTLTIGIQCYWEVLSILMQAWLEAPSLTVQSRSRTGTSSARRGSQRGRGGTSRGGRGSSSQQGMDQSVGRANWDHGPRGGAAGPEVAVRGGYQPVTNSHTSFGYGRQYSKSTHYQEFMNKSSLYPSYEP